MRTLVAAAFTCLLFTSCVPSTPQARIQANPSKFDALSRQDQESVRNGQITPGMSADAVLFAWGSPSNRFQGVKNKTLTERWDYAGTQPVYTQNFYGFYGGGFGRGRGRNADLAFALGPDIAYIPYRIASVWFVNQRVDSWERGSGANTAFSGPPW